MVAQATCCCEETTRYSEVGHFLDLCTMDGVDMPGGE